MGRVCPNAECPFLRKHGFAPTYRGAISRCADCGGALVETAAESGGSVAALSSPTLPRGASTLVPLAVVTASVAALLLLQRLPLPFVDVEVLGGAVMPALSVVAVGVAPFVAAALLVEIAAALVPSWRALRLPAGRARLVRATDVLGVVLAGVQAFMLLQWIDGASAGALRVLTTDEPLARAAVLVTVVAGAVLCRWIARLVDARGLGSGMSLLLAAPLALQLLLSLAELPLLVRDGAVSPGAVALRLLLVAAAAAVAVLVVRPLADDGAPPLPMAGVLPLAWAAPLSQWQWAAVPVAALLLTPLLARLLHGRGSLSGPPLTLSMLCIAAWAALDVLGERTGARSVALLDTVGVVVVVAVLRDLAAELAFARDQGPLARVGVVPSLAAAGRAQARLATLGIAAHVRAAHHRALLHFFGPHLELELLVPLEHRERARVLLAHGQLDEELPASATAAAPGPPSSPPAAAPAA